MSHINSGPDRPSPDALGDTLQAALQHHQAGRLPEAEALYRQMLRQDPNHTDALHMLGVLAGQVRQYDVALRLIQQAIVLRPQFPEAFINLGHILGQTGRFGEAVAAFRRAIAQDPGIPEAHCNLGNSLRAQGDLPGAIAACRQALALRPDFPEAHLNLGNALKDNGQVEEAIAAYCQALVFSPRDADALSNLGNTLRETGALDQAIAACRQAIAVDPAHPAAHNNLASALEAAGDLAGAIAEYDQAIALQPGFTEAHRNRGNALRAMGRPDAALEAYRHALQTGPDHPGVHLNLGNALRDQGLLDEAMAAYHQALALNPRLAGAHSNLVFTMHYCGAYDARAIAGELCRWNLLHAEPLESLIRPYDNDRNPERPLRIGYVSPDFRDHPVGRFMGLLLAGHDRARVQVFAYSDALRTDGVTRELQSHADAWRHVAGQSDAHVAQLVRQDRIDILVDLALHTQGNRLLVFARKPAPVQVSFAGYPGSAGLHAIDYRLSDAHLEPPGLFDELFPDQAIRLPHSFWCFAYDAPDPQVNALPAAAGGGITFGCLNTFCKINDDTLRLWAQVMQRVPGSRLVLLAWEGDHRRRTALTLSHAGVAAERLEFVSPRARSEYLKLYHRLDMSLDTLPYNGHMTSLDSLWMGVPVITLVGRTIVGRAGLSQLMTMGLPELVTRAPDEFVATAAALAGDLPRLAELRRTLRPRLMNSPLADAAAMTHAVEDAYGQMWRKWCAGGR